jgi:hypothetical protein
VGPRASLDDVEKTVSLIKMNVHACMRLMPFIRIMTCDNSSLQSCFNKGKLKNKEGVWGRLIEGQRE